MDLEAFRQLLTPRGRQALAEAGELTAAGADPVVAATTLRRTYDAALTSAALTQAGLRERARAKFGEDAGLMFFTPHGLEQSTRKEVAEHRARRLTGPGADPDAGPHVLDVCCGIGGDFLALARAGCTVTAVDVDPLTAAVATANAEALGVGDRVRVVVGNAGAVRPEEYDALFADPARRGGRGRTFDPMAYSPPWPTVLDLLSRARRGCVKVAPGFPYEYMPEGSETEWVSYKGELKEAALWTGAGRRPVRRATLLPGGHTLAATGQEPDTPVGPLGRYVYEPDPAAIRGHLVAEVAELVGGRLIDRRIAYIAADEPVDTPWAARYAVDEVMTFSLKKLRAALRERSVGNVTIKKRGSAVDIERLRADLRLNGEKSAVIILTRILERPYALICDTFPPA
ncbi:methyltransferase domain-containing protein [Actinomadura sp. ATCC 31491]|uniref:Methyltransferase domain-containing protein n=1 Tax=Actinomadura luzonensis TaxID=2805427 RepID=A0ABT0FTB8_9ACTN|nr:class I SAM-dependent methyltransferase [Actinomadura luzonensis]MCK2215143.1 methyltransferase domain-containing protein [Actinomadura luzonensis]